MKYKQFFVIMFCLVLMGGLASLISPILITKWMADNTGFSSNRILMLLFALIITIFLEITLTFFREKFAEGFNIKNCKSMLFDFFNLPYDEINEKGPTNLVERIVIAVNSYYSYMTGDFIKLWSSVIVVIVIFIIILMHNTLLALILLSFIPLNYLGYKALNKELQKRSRTLQEATSSGWQEVLSITNQTDYLKQSDSYEYILKQIDPSLRKIYGATKNVNVFAQISGKLLESINQIGQVMIMAMVIYNFMGAQDSILSLILYSIVLPLYFSNITIISHANLKKRDMIISQSLIKEWQDNKEKSGDTDIDSINSIVLDIEYLRIKDKVLSKDIKGHFQKGDIVWVKGDSGTGKSTLVKLLLKFRETDTIMVNGIDIRTISNKSLRKYMDYLSQNVPIIKGTLRDNIFLNKPYDKEIEEKLKDDLILKSLTKNITFDTEIKEGGSNLSGGEKQKIAIARIIFNNSDVLILDEVTSNIDKESAMSIMHRIIKEHEKKIIFVISHDDLPSSFANKLIVLE